VITTFSALTSAVKELIPTPRQHFSVNFNEFADVSNIASTKPSARLQSHWIKPKLRQVVIALNVNVLRFVAVPGVKEEPIGSNSQCRRHALHGIAAPQE